MAIAQREAEVVWEGVLARGTGSLTSGSGVLDGSPVTWAARTEGPNGKTSPEELVAAAHASCFAMALALVRPEILQVGPRDGECRWRRLSSAHRTRGVLVAKAATRARGRGYFIARRRKHVPKAAERVHARSVRVAGLLVDGEQIERVPVVGDLRRAVRARARRNDRSIHSTADRRHPGRP